MRCRREHGISSPFRVVALHLVREAKGSLEVVRRQRSGSRFERKVSLEGREAEGAFRDADLERRDHEALHAVVSPSRRRSSLEAHARIASKDANCC